jgi:hypothetical protein
MFSQKWPLKPTSRKTPRGGNRMARIILTGSVAVTAMATSRMKRVSGLADLKVARQ